VIHAVSSDHQTAAEERNRHFHGVGRKFASKPGRSCYAAQAPKHHEENDYAAMLAKSNEQSHCPKERNEQSQGAVNTLFSGKKMG
jgi:hypothetical protein